ncbi:MAG: ABC transporter permease [Bryobacterales bacterium]|nr:ABC transporter permease [Bryobacterales bacterium]
MRWVTLLRMRLRTLVARKRVEQELDEELQYHLEREIETGVAEGLDPREAKWAALRKMGCVAQNVEECRDARGWNRMEQLWSDARFGVRQLSRGREFSLLAVVILALGICASVAIFALVDAALLKPLPYREPEKLLSVYERIPQCTYCNISWLDYLDWKAQNTTLAGLELYQGRGHTMNAASGAVMVRGARVSDGFFRLLGVGVALGRDFHGGEDKAGAPRTVILSHGAWQQLYGGDRAVLGRKVVLDRIPRTIVGVLPKEFHFAPVGSAEFWTPFHPETSCDLRRSCHAMYSVGRLKEGVSMEAALANLVSIAKELERQYPATNRNQGANAQLLSEAIIGDTRPVLLLLMGGAGLLLAIAISNVTGLLLVRSEGRRREMAVRSALGASSWRLISQFATESLLLTGAAMAVGCVSAHWVMQMLIGMLPEDMLLRMPYWSDLGWSPRVAGFALAVGAAAAVLCALAPQVQIWGQQVRAGLAEGTRGSTGMVWRNLGSKLAVVEVATAMVLLVGAGLLGKSLYRLMQVKLGFEPGQLVTMEIAAPDAVYGEAAKASELARRVLREVRALPGVRSAGLSANGGLLGHNGNTTWLRIAGRPETEDHLDLPERDVTADFFTTIGARLASGRYFQEGDDASKPPVAIVNQEFVRRFLPNEEPVGKRVTKRADAPIEIVGVVEDVRLGPLNAPIPPVLYVPFHQNADTYFTLVVRADVADEGSLLPVLRETMRRIDGEIVTRREFTLTEWMERTPAAYVQRSTAWLVGGFAGMAMLLALVGLYGVIAYSVGQRRREIGVRMALGAQTGQVYRMVLREAAWLSLLGIGLGSVGAGVLANWARELLFGVSPWDVGVLLGIAGGLALAAQVAGFVPARRASCVDPASVLRME